MSDRREIWAWALYDFANSAYSTALAGVIFSVYFVQEVVGPEGFQILGLSVSGTALWGYSVSFSMLVVALTAPVLGTVADYRAKKKKFLFVSYLGGISTTAVLFLVGAGDVWLALTFYILSNIGLEWSQTFYNSFLPEIASREEMGRVSGFGWGLGYVGGVLALVLSLVVIERPGWFGLSADNYLPVRTTFLLVAVWWGVFSLPTFIWLKERAVVQTPPPGSAYVRIALQRLSHTFRKISHFRQLVKFLIAFLLYNDAVQTVIVMAAVFAAEVLGMTREQLIPCWIWIHIVAFAGSLMFGYVGDRVNTKTAIHICLFLWSAVIIYVLFVREVWEFWILATLAGFVLGGVQASSRALLAQFTPVGNSAEFFGFFSTSQKAAAIFGPFLFAAVNEATGSTRVGVGSVLVFLVAGWAIFRRVDQKQGIVESRHAV